MKHLKWYFLAALLTIADQFTKSLVFDYMELYETFEVTNFLSITHAHNYGAAFSFLANQDGWQQYFLVSISAIASLAIIIWMAKTSTTHWAKLGALGMILSGAIGNLIDRFALGFVVDFIDVHYQELHWPIFNIADITIALGVILLIVIDIKQTKRSNNE